MSAPTPEEDLLQFVLDCLAIPADRQAIQRMADDRPPEPAPPGCITCGGPAMSPGAMYCHQDQPYGYPR